MNATREMLLQRGTVTPFLPVPKPPVPRFPVGPPGRYGAVNRTVGDARSLTATPPPPPAPRAPTAAERAAAIRSNQASAARLSGMAAAARAPINANMPQEPFDPLSYNWSGEGGGSRASGVDVEALRAAQLGAEETSGLSGDGGNGGGGGGSGDSGSDSLGEPGEYSSEGAALSAEVFGALAERRRTVDEQLQKAMEQERFQTQRLQLAAQTARTQVAREFRNLAEDLQMRLGGRGLATDPRFAGRGRRRLQMQQDEKFGEISQTLSDEISALQEMVQTVSDARDREMAKIAQDEALARTMPAALLPAALQYTSN